MARLARRHMITGDAREAEQSNIMVAERHATGLVPSVGSVPAQSADRQGAAAYIDS
jgi:hypothetical protein